MYEKELLLAKSWSAHLEKWLSGLSHGQFQGGGSTLAKIAAKTAADKLRKESNAKADAMVREADARAQALLAEARKQADQIKR